MKRVALTPPHLFTKENMVTLKGGYDIMKCSFCGIKGKRKGLVDFITVPDSVSDKKIKYCTGKILENDSFVGKQIEVTNCGANGPIFENIHRWPFHTIVTPPDGYVNGDRGVWVMGVGEPVKLLFGEYKMHVMKRTKK